MQVVDWRELVENGNFAAAEEAMRKETEAMDQFGENTVTARPFTNRGVTPWDPVERRLKNITNPSGIGASSRRGQPVAAKERQG